MASAANVKKSLIKQLEIKGAKVEIYMSLVDDYIWLWKQEREMQRDIKDQGRTYTTTSAAGKEYEKENPSVKNALLYSKQMVSILTALGLSTQTVISENAKDDNPDDL
jgi:phage terminase small subunit